MYDDDDDDDTLACMQLRAINMSGYTPLGITGVLVTYCVTYLTK